MCSPPSFFLRPCLFGNLLRELNLTYISADASKQEKV
jgi:hypothetical protein